MVQIATLEHGQEDRDEQHKRQYCAERVQIKPGPTPAITAAAASTTAQPIQTGQAVSGVETLTAVTATRTRFWRGIAAVDQAVGPAARSPA